MLYLSHSTCVSNQDYSYSWFTKTHAFSTSLRAINYARSRIIIIIINDCGHTLGACMCTCIRLGVIARSIYNAPYLRPWLNIVARWLPRNDDPGLKKKTALVDKSLARARFLAPDPVAAGVNSRERYLKRD